MSCSVVNASAFFPPPPPPSDEGPGWLALGVILALLSVSLLTLGTNVQRYGLSVVMARGSCCGARGPVGCMSCSTAVWAGGWLIYVCGNGVYTFAVTLAPATLQGSGSEARMTGAMVRVVSDQGAPAGRLEEDDILIGINDTDISSWEFDDVCDLLQATQEDGGGWPLRVMVLSKREIASEAPPPPIQQSSACIVM